MARLQVHLWPFALVLLMLVGLWHIVAALVLVLVAASEGVTSVMRWLCHVHGVEVPDGE